MSLLWFFLMATLSLSYYNVNGWSPVYKLASRIAAAPPTGTAMIPIRRSKSSSKTFGTAVLKRIVRSTTARDNDLSEVDVSLLKSENNLLRDTIRQLEEENKKLKQRHNKIVLETFEGERYFRDESEGASTLMDTGGITMTGDEIGQDELWCDELDGGKLSLCY
jgi:hypothetical protein